ncbi:Lipase 5 [Saitoella coloradoensis]
MPVPQCVGVVLHPWKTAKRAWADNVSDRENALNRQLWLARLSAAKNYEEYAEACRELDKMDPLVVAWKKDPASPYYNHLLLQRLIGTMRRMREEPETTTSRQMLWFVRSVLRRDVGGILHPGLYRHTRIGTKDLIMEFNDEAIKFLETLAGGIRSEPNPSLDDLIYLERELTGLRSAYGQTALLLSGGANMGMTHIGVLKTLFQAKLLPRVISGSSAGSIVASALCVRIDEEIPDFLNAFSKLFNLDVFGTENWMGRLWNLWKKGALLDITNLRLTMRDLIGEMTFSEAYNRTRRVLNVTVSSGGIYEMPRLLNYITAPNVLIWSAVCASCSLPFVYQPSQLLTRDPENGTEVPWDPKSAPVIDGSVEGDLPHLRLSELFNVNHFVVSQVNPHVIPFLAWQQLGSHEPLDTDAVPDLDMLEKRPTMIQKAWEMWMGEMEHACRMIGEVGVGRMVTSKVASVLSQRYSGDITILPDMTLNDVPNLLENPTPEFLDEATRRGERVTWPVVERIRMGMKVEDAVDRAVAEARARVIDAKWAPIVGPMQEEVLNVRREEDDGNGGKIRRRVHLRRRSHDAWRSAPLRMTALVNGNVKASNVLPFHNPALRGLRPELERTWSSPPLRGTVDAAENGKKAGKKERPAVDRTSSLPGITSPRNLRSPGSGSEADFEVERPGIDRRLSSPETASLDVDQDWHELAVKEKERARGLGVRFQIGSQMSSEVTSPFSLSESVSVAEERRRHSLPSLDLGSVNNSLLDEASSTLADALIAPLPRSYQPSPTLEMFLRRHESEAEAAALTAATRAAEAAVVSTSPDMDMDMDSDDGGKVTEMTSPNISPPPFGYVDPVILELTGNEPLCMDADSFPFPELRRLSASSSESKEDEDKEEEERKNKEEEEKRQKEEEKKAKMKKRTVGQTGWWAEEGDLFPPVKKDNDIDELL